MLRKIASGLIALVLVGSFVTPAQAANPANVPTFGTVQSVAGGFAVPITNWDAAFTYTAIGSDCSGATVANGWLNVTGVITGQTVSARVITNRSGYDEGTATVSGASNSFIARGTVNPATTMSSANNVYDSAGNVYQAWSEGSAKAHLSKSSDGGASWTSVKTFTLTTPASQISTGVAISPTGKLAMVWQEGPNNSNKVMVSVSSDAGATWTTPTELNPAANTQLVSVQWDADDDLVVAWNEISTTYFYKHRVSENFGVTWSATANISLANEPAYYPVLVKTTSGDIYAAWTSGSSIRASRFIASSNTWGSSAAISVASFPAFPETSFVSSGTGNLAAIWTEGGVASEHVNLSTFNGTSWSATVQATDSVGTLSSPTLAFSSTTVIAGWHEGNAGKMRVGSLGVNGITWGPVQSPTPSGNGLYQFKVGTYGNGNFAAVWLRQPASGFYVPEVTYSTDSGATWSAAQRLGAENEDHYQPIFFTDNNGRLGVVWRIQGNGTSLKSTSLTVASADPRTIYQVAEINPGDINSHSSIYDIEILNNKMYLIAKHADTGFELFEYANGQINLVADLNPGPGNGLYDQEVLANTGSALYLAGSNGVTGYEVYKFDGTNITLAASFNPATTTPSDASGQLTAGSNPGADGSSIVFGNKLYVSSSFPSWGSTYVLDLANPNAVPVAMSAHFTGWTQGGFGSPVVLGSDLYFIANHASGSAVYKTNGTATPTEVPGTSGKAALMLSTFGSRLVFTGNPSGDNFDYELFSWDSAAPSVPAGLVANINSFNSGSNGGSLPNQYTVRCNTVYFVAGSGGNNPGFDRELWQWDGYSVTRTQDFAPGTDASGPTSPHAIGNELFVFASSPGNGTEPWIRKGSEFSMIQDFRPGSAGSISGTPPVVTWNNQTYTSMWGPTGLELYAYGVQPQNHQVSSFAMTYNITFDANTGTGTTTTSHSAGSVALHSGTGFTKAGKQLLGWDTSSTATTATYALGASYSLAGHVTLYAVWGDPVQTPSGGPANIPTLSSPTGGFSGTTGSDIELKGSGFGGVTSAEIDAKEAEIKKKTDTSLTIELPELDPGTYDLTLKTISGQVTLQDAIRVRKDTPFLTPEALAQIAAWTKINASKTKVRLVAKNPVSIGKLQFKLNGKEVAWVNAVDGSDPKLRVISGTSYFNRVLTLPRGKNAIEIYLNGQRVKRVAYTR